MKRYSLVLLISVLDFFIYEYSPSLISILQMSSLLYPKVSNMPALANILYSLFGIVEYVSFSFKTRLRKKKIFDRFINSIASFFANFKYNWFVGISNTFNSRNSKSNISILYNKIII